MPLGHVSRVLVGVAFWALLCGQLLAVPYFARKYDVRCRACHTFPPNLNQFGLDFVARGYRMEDEKAAAARRTVPAAVWMTQRFERKSDRDLTKSFPNRIEIISGGEITDRLSYFLEWRPLSYETTGSGRLRNRSGRFEDLFLILKMSDSLSLTVGQFRMLSQWDSSRKLSLSTPAVFSSGVGGRRALQPRLTGLRSFSLEGRSPSLRFSAVKSTGASPADGWFHELTIPFAGEFSLPLVEEARQTASFEFEARPKGVLYETYLRSGLSSAGGSLFVGDDRWMGNLIAQKRLGDHQIYSSAGTARHRGGLQDFRFTIGNYWIPRDWLAMGMRADHRSADGLGLAFVPHVNLQFPGEKYTVMLVAEPFLQKGNTGVSAELSLVF